MIHTVGPVWNNGTAGEEELLRLAYHRSLEVAVSNEIRSIAFPSISTGAYRFPFELATVIARDTISAFLKNTDQPAVVIMVAFAEKDYQRMLKIYNESSDNSG